MWEIGVGLTLIFCRYSSGVDFRDLEVFKGACGGEYRSSLLPSLLTKPMAGKRTGADV